MAPLPVAYCSAWPCHLGRGAAQVYCSTFTYLGMKGLGIIVASGICKIELKTRRWAQAVAPAALVPALKERLATVTVLAVCLTAAKARTEPSCGDRLVSVPRFSVCNYRQRSRLWDLKISHACG